jgi:murein DD-endopeptidase MepM/ murein hydrolase activator NlpD
MSLLLVQVLPQAAARAQQFDQTLAWPLCGRITENAPAGWNESDGCPAERWGDADHSDLSLNSPFGPRPLASENDRYDFHRGIDIATPEGTPVFAIADGIVKIAGDHSSYSDPLVQLRHYRPGHSSCADVGCYHSNYMHLSDAAVDVDETVSKGELIGYTGRSASGFAHLHFEVRDAPPDDIFSRWQRDTISPLEVLPYQSPDSAALTFESVDVSDPDNPIARVVVTTSRVDVRRVELFVYDSAYQPVAQPGNQPDAHGYNVNPPWFDMNVWNRQYTHKDSSSVPWESFGAGGENECPYHADHGPNYDAHVHMDRQDPLDFHVGLFNGVRVETQKYNPGDYRLTLTFNELQGPAHCILGKVQLSAGGEASGQWGDCSGLSPQADDQSVATGEDQPIDITLTGSSPSGGDLTYLVTSDPLDGALSGTPPEVTYTPDPGFAGSDSFQFLVDDGTAQSDDATVSITVGSANTPPVADDQSLTTPKNTPLDITLTGSDGDGDPLSFAVTAGPSQGTLTGSGDQRTYTPDTDYTGQDAFTFEVSDPDGASDTATVSINVKKGRGGGGSGGGDDGGGGGPDCTKKPDHPKC